MSSEAVAIAAVDWHRAVASIEDADEVCLACHVCPDGDALGSMLAFARVLHWRGKRFVASFGDPFAVPANLRFLPDQELLHHPAGYPAAPEVMVTFDAASIERLGSLAANAAKASELVVIDHHASNTRFGTTHLLDPDVASTSMIVEELIRRWGAPVSQEIAMNLYVGLVTDTGSFKYESTDPRVHELAGRLLETGIRPERVSGELWDRAPFGYLRVLSGALARARLDPTAAGGRGLVWTSVSRAERIGHQVDYDTLEPLIDVVRRTEEAEVAVVFKENDEGVWYVSTRSKGAVDLSRVCAALGGGGNPTMAGFLWPGSVDEAIEWMRDLLVHEHVGSCALP